jgi:starch synthase
MSLRVLFLTSEVTPFAKTGGLADVAGSLPKALAALGHDVRVMMPAYASIERALQDGQWGLRAVGPTLRVPILGGINAGTLQAMLPGTSVPVEFIAERDLFDRADLYGYPDDPYRFAFFCRAALQWVVETRAWRPDIVHAHDWHAAAAILWLATSGQDDLRYRDLPTVLTIHNLLHQGRTSIDILRYLGVRGSRLYEEGVDEVNVLARGIYHATMINTVSPTYAREILTPDGGMRLDGLLRYRQYDVHGILNGLDYDVWNPETDRHLARTYDANTLERRADNKRALQARMGLAQRDDVPVVAIVSRLDVQKGVDLVEAIVPRLLGPESARPRSVTPESPAALLQSLGTLSAPAAQLIVLGSGAAEHETALRRLAAAHPGRMAAMLRYDPVVAPLIYGGSDVFLMPSRFEPCGLGQMIAMRYGCVPVVRATGGLVDTVQDGVTGFSFGPYDADAFWDALQRALRMYREEPAAWRVMQQRGMAADFSWTASARGYEHLYEWAIARVRGR